MSMGNYLNVGGVDSDTMATRQSTVGVDHPTVVPANFDPESVTCPECGRSLSEH